jgi:hypothetical protein
MYRIFVSLFLFCLLPMSALGRFSDQEEIPLWAEEAVDIVFDADLMTGFGDGSFRPWRELNRAEAVTLLLRIKGIEPSAVTKSSRFSDVDRGDWFEAAVVNATQEGWLEGHPDGTFRPAEKLNRAQFAVMIQRAFDLETEDFEMVPSFRDISLNHWYGPAVFAMYNNNLIRSPNSQSYFPNKKVSRAEAAWIMAQIFSMPRLMGTSEENDFSQANRIDSRRTAIRPKDFNPNQQSYEVEKKAIHVYAEPISQEPVSMNISSDWTSVGNLRFENTLDEPVEINALSFRLRFDQNAVGPASNFFVRIEGDTMEAESMLIARNGEALFTGIRIDIEPGASASFDVSLKPDTNQQFYPQPGTAKLSISDGSGLSFAEFKREGAAYSTGSKFAHFIYETRQFGPIDFNPTVLNP